MTRQEIFAKIGEERAHQDRKWGRDFDKFNTANDWAAYIALYAGRAGRAGSWHRIEQDYRDNLIKVAALAVAALEAMDLTGGLPPTRTRNDVPAA